MDENYLDQLLKAVENQNSTMEEPEEFISEDESVQDSDMEEKLSEDASAVPGVAWSDAEIPVDEISELDELDELADLDMDALDFEDIDFDDIDVTKMDVNPVPLKNELDNLEFMDIDEQYLDDSDAQAFEEEFKRMKEAEKAEKAGTPEAVYEDQDFVNTLEPEMQGAAFGAEEADMNMDMDMDANMGMGMDTDTDAYASVPGDSDLDDSGDMMTDIDALMNEVFGESGGTEFSKEPETPSMEKEEPENSDNDMDDLFAMLGIEENSATTAASSMPDVENEIPDFEIPPELADVKDMNETKKKKGFMDILFGEEDDEEVLTPEQEEELKKEKEEKKKAKLAKKAEKRGEKAEKKKTVKDNKAVRLNEKKAARKAEEERILAEEGPEKKLNKPLVVIIMVFFLALGGIVIAGSSIFDYSLAITKAKGYFERQKYGLAYREIIGVDVRQKDEDLESRIYTVMYVERQYEAYQNYVGMDAPDLALNALLSGLDKYDEYYADAVELDIVEDLDYAKTEIVSALYSTYGLTEADAREILALEDSEYTERIQDMTADMTRIEE